MKIEEITSPSLVYINSHNNVGDITSDGNLDGYHENEILQGILHPSENLVSFQVVIFCSTALYSMNHSSCFFLLLVRINHFTMYV